MRKQRIFHNLVMISLLNLIAGCGKDDGCEQKTFYYDFDGDGYGIESSTTTSCSKPTKYAEKKGDPDDENDLIFPGCVEQTFYEDSDQDDYGNSEVTITACGEAPQGYVDVADDPNDKNPEIFPGCETSTYYRDKDGDGFGDPNDPVQWCAPDPENRITGDNTDCNDEDPKINPDVTATYYEDFDQDGYGNPEKSQLLPTCPNPEENGWVLDNTDCDDGNPDTNPGEMEIGGNGADRNCDGFIGIIWDGPEITFSKAANADWTLEANQDKLTERVVFTRQNASFIYNYQWWQDVYGEDAEHVDANNSDLNFDFGTSGASPIKNLGDANGGTKRVLWALLDDTGASTSWDDFQLYGTIGDNTHYYSFHNIASIIVALETKEKVESVLDNLSIEVEGSANPYSDRDMSLLIGKKLGVWLEDDDVYLTLTFTEWGGAGGAISYTRSTPPETN